MRPRSDLPALDGPGTAVWEGEPLVLVQDTLVLRVLQESVTLVLLADPAAPQGDGADPSPAPGQLPGLSSSPPARGSLTASTAPTPSLSLTRQRLVELSDSALEVELERFDLLLFVEASFLIVCREDCGSLH